MKIASRRLQLKMTPTCPPRRSFVASDARHRGQIFKRLEHKNSDNPLRLGGRDTFTHPGIDLHPLDLFQQCLRHAADLRRNRFDCRPKGWVLPRCSCTILTARSRTSGENLFDVFMLHLLKS
jgi:hypothetical protein